MDPVVGLWDRVAGGRNGRVGRAWFVEPRFVLVGDVRGAEADVRGRWWEPGLVVGRHLRVVDNLVAAAGFCRWGPVAWFEGAGGHTLYCGLSPSATRAFGDDHRSGSVDEPTVVACRFNACVNGHSRSAGPYGRADHGPLCSDAALRRLEPVLHR